MASARLGGSRRAASSAFIPVKTGIQEALPKTGFPDKQNADDTNLSLRRRPQSRKRALENVCLFVLDARLIGRFPLMPLAWIPAYAGMTLVEGRYSWCASIVGATLFSTKF